MIGETTARLRAETADSHQRLEESLDLFTKVAERGSRRRLVERFHGLHAGAEQALAPWLAAIDGLEFDDRSRLPHLRRDLKTLGVSGEAAICPVATPADAAEALGLFYVLEGSTLGGHMIGKQLARDGVDDEGLTFLNPYGAAVGERWRAFMTVLERETASASDRDAAVAGARRGFALVTDWLCEAA